MVHRLGERPPKTFDSAAAHYIQWSAGKDSLESEIYQLVSVMPYIKDMDISEIDDDVLDDYINYRILIGRKSKTINLTLGVVRHILNLCETEFKYENKLSWLDRAPKITMLDLNGMQRPPYPISWEEQDRLIAFLPPHLKRMALFTINTGVRDVVTCNLKWEWELFIPELGISVFDVPKEFVKGKKADRTLVCNSVSQAQVEEARGMHPEYVFVYRRERVKNLDMAPTMPYMPIETMNNSGWQTARKKAGLKDLHGHDLRHTTAMRLRENKVEHKTIADILWHSHKDTTSHYTLEQIAELAEAMDLITKNAGRWNRTLDQLRKEKFRSVPKDSNDHKSA